MAATVRNRARAAWTGVLFVLGGLGVLALYMLAIWHAPEFLVNQDQLARAAPEQRLPAEHNARLIVISAGGALVVGTGLLYTARNYRLAHRGQVTERFTKALERLGSDELYVRIGGVHALEHVMRDSPEHHSDVVEVLVAFIRDRLPRTVTESVNERQWMHPPSGTDKPELPTEPAADVQAALTALGKRPKRTKLERDPLNLRQLHIEGVRLVGAQFERADLRAANLRNAILDEADLKLADLREADLQDAKLRNANLQEADLRDSNLQLANLWRANLRQAVAHRANLNKAFLYAADFQNARLGRANLQNAHLDAANLQNAYLHEANLQNATMEATNLQNAHLAEANLQAAKLEGANIQNANMEKANLLYADLYETNLQNANMSGATVTVGQLRQATASERAVLPEGLTRDPLGEIWEKNLS